ncbi:FAD binding domain-containing protein [Pseudonocardia hydrocarbonoxydans]|uniref:Carbon-monoxide dehydrogenase medium subunit n=1 Tax=Pseudonocardia hydrocarbonoxydans TaxID=76726 RepID=A0A4Y3WQC0_9PSEU|nr:xanthine dehydrogenase family protein subunit M [Pseudonocardia hydrocarbonoxydans]GEC20009.1 carbon-monoxide dehydrogenase medium subunit [Pseudonocardia hydrocarbonoxydans]
MKPPPFQYAAPTSVAEAVELLAAHADDDARTLAGGQSLVPLMNFRLAQPGYLVDLGRIEELTRIRTDGDTLVIGAMVRQSDAEHAPEVALRAPLLAEALGYVAHPPVRNSGTVGGSIAHADPAAELPAVALALDAELVVVGPQGTRTVRAADFFVGPFATAIEAGEILTEVRFPRRDGGQSFVEFARTHGNFALVGVASVIETDGATIARASIAMSGVAPVPVRATAAEETLAGSAPDDASIRAAVDAAVAGLSPSGDAHGSAETRTDIARSYLRRGIELALTRAQDRR